MWRAFSGFCKTIGNALPLKLLSFSGKEQVNLVHLTRQTSDEINNTSFIIQRSSDGRLFMDLGSTIARNTNGNNSYDYIDNHPLSNINYYRLLMMDRDGKRHTARLSGLILVPEVQICWCFPTC